MDTIELDVTPNRSHSHSNKDVLDQITETMVTEAHSHDNKTVLDGITAAKVTAWDSAATGSGTAHSHANKSALDEITDAKIASWDAGADHSGLQPKVTYGSTVPTSAPSTGAGTVFIKI